MVGLVISDSSNYSAQDVMNYLTEHGVGVRPFFYPLHMQPVFKEQDMFKGEQYPNSEKLYKKGFYIPSGLGITDNEISIVASKVNQLIRKFFKIYKV